MKLRAMSVPEMEKVQILWRERVTSHGATDSSEATVAPRPRSTRTDGSAQQRSVLSEVKREK